MVSAKANAPEQIENGLVVREPHGVVVAVGETFILLHLPLPSVGVSVGMWRGRQQSDSLADG